LEGKIGIFMLLKNWSMKFMRRKEFSQRTQSSRRKNE
jgi:hypothetical protein